LRIRGEVEYPVPPLAQAEAVELFCARSQQHGSDDIAELCRRLDNLPLAVELAAARTSVLSPAQILERLSERLDLLKGGRDADSRQQTLRATIEWSYELLNEKERRLFARLSVFAGGCTLEAATDVAEADLDTLQSLVDKSLVRHSDERFWMLETIREFALERLEETGDAEDLRHRHSAYFLELGESARPELLAGRSSIWFDRLEAEHDNVRVVLGDPLEPEDGTELFLARAHAVEPGFAASAAVPELCARLEQLPLALELAAARVRVLSPEQLLDRLAGRLDLLKAGRGVGARPVGVAARAARSCSANSLRTKGACCDTCRAASFGGVRSGQNRAARF